jgi:dolichyl-phosphate-mannose-protein mannosyltransferase
MVDTPPVVRQRGGRKKTPVPGSDEEPLLDVVKQQVTKPKKKVAAKSSSTGLYSLALVVCTALAFVTRFWKINHPNEVVFDEVHFGKFASYYLQRTYFFDVHPPFAKLLFAFVGWLIGYDGA